MSLCTWFNKTASPNIVHMIKRSVKFANYNKQVSVYQFFRLKHVSVDVSTKELHS